MARRETEQLSARSDAELLVESRDDAMAFAELYERHAVAMVTFFIAERVASRRPLI